MDFVNKAYAQLRDLFLSMTPGARITSGLLLAVVVVSLGYLVQMQASGPGGFLMDGEVFSQTELRKMQLAFGKAGLSGFETDLGRVRIPRGQQAAFMAALAEAGAMPAGFGADIERALEGGSVWEGRHAKVERLKAAKQRELAKIIGAINGIASDSVSVLYDVDKQKWPDREWVATAAVSVGTSSGEPLDRQRVSDLRKTVAGGIIGLKPENVTLVDLNGRAYTGGADAFGAIDDTHFTRQEQYENYTKDKILSALSYVRGIKAQVHVELDKEIIREQDSLKHDPKGAVPVRVSEKSTESTKKGGGPGGRVGLQSQQESNSGASIASSRSSSNTSSEITENNETQSALSSSRTKIRFQGQTPTKMTASIMVPSSYYAQVWHKANPPPAGQPPGKPDKQQLKQIEEDTKAKIRNTVKHLIGLPDKVDPATRIAVETFESLSPPPSEGPSFAERALAWTGQYWSTLTMTGLAGFSLLMLRSMVKSVPATDVAGAASPPTFSLVSDEESEEDEEEEAEGTAKRRFVKGPSFKDDLADMVREDPDAAATILRTWIASTA